MKITDPGNPHNNLESPRKELNTIIKIADNKVYNQIKQTRKIIIKMKNKYGQHLHTCGNKSVTS
jgi:hypothetical protein